MRKVKYVENIILVEEYHEQENQRVNNVLADDGYDDVSVGTSEPFLASIKLHLHTESVCREQSHEKHQDTGHKDGSQTVIVTTLGIGYHVCVDGYGLQRRLDLRGRCALCTKRGLSHSRRAKHTDSLHIL